MGSLVVPLVFHCGFVLNAISIAGAGMSQNGRIEIDPESRYVRRLAAHCYVD